ncbi:MAG: hypothetical protein E7260_09825 [Lachnospiraceae bacterium]|nr:hypothetical protein [Lachnospiraceae bacterium]
MKKKNSFSGFSGAFLKWLALISMFLDHVGAVLIKNGIWPQVTGAVLGGTSFDYLPKDYRFWFHCYNILRYTGRLAFPIYCFLLVEGFFHTTDRKKYALRLGALALLSELPYDLAFYNTVFSFQLQNVFFTLLLGLLAIWGFEYIKNKRPQSRFLPYLPVLAAMVAAYVLRTDYDAFGVLLITLLYLLIDARKQLCIFGGIVTLWEYTAPLAFVPIFYYNGTRGKQPPKWFFYGFYPIHLLFLWILRFLFFR